MFKRKEGGGEALDKRKVFSSNVLDQLSALDVYIKRISRAFTTNRAKFRRDNKTYITLIERIIVRIWVLKLLRRLGSVHVMDYIVSLKFMKE